MARSAAAVLSLVPLVFILSGCGGSGDDSGKGGDSGGGSDPASDPTKECTGEVGKCTNEKMQLVSQSVDMEGSFEAEMPNPSASTNMKMSVPVAICEKLDMEFMKWFIDYRVNITELNPFIPNNPFKLETIHVKMMLDVPKKQAAFAMNAPVPGAPGGMANCTVVKIPYLGAPETVAKCVKDGFDKEGLAPPMVPGIAIEGPACQKDICGLDVWTIKFQNETQTPIGYEMMSVTESFKLDKNYLFREAEMSVKVGTKATMFGSLNSKGVPKTVGASDTDVDYTQWGFGTCQEMPIGGGGGPPPQLQQMLMALSSSSKPGASSVVPLLLQHKDTIQGRRLQGGGSGGLPMPPALPAWAACFMPPPAEVSMVV